MLTLVYAHRHQARLEISETVHKNQLIWRLFQALSLTLFQVTSPALALSKTEYDTQTSLAYKDVFANHYERAEAILQPLSRSPYADKVLYATLADCCRQEWGSHPVHAAEAIRYCKKAIQLDPEYGHAYHVWGQTASIEARQEEAIGLFTKALNCKEPDLTARYNRAKAYAAIKQYTLALKDLDDWEKIHRVQFKSDTNSLMAASVVRGQVLEAMGKYDLAITAYRASYPHYRSTWTEQEILTCLIKAKRYKEAIEELSSRIRKNQDDDESYYARGQLKIRIADYQGAVDDYTRAITVVPAASYFRERAKAYEKLGKPELSKKDIAKADSL